MASRSTKCRAKIGSTGPRGLHHLVYEIVDNSVDEALAGYASHIEVTILPDTGFRVVDDGRGIPVDEVPGEGVSGVESVMTKLQKASPEWSRS